MKYLLSTVDQLISQLSPISSLLDRVVEMVVPHATATACSDNYYVCYTGCAFINNTACHQQNKQNFVKYASYTLGCPQIDCLVVTGTCC
jgi:hypothetical protein